MSQKNFASYGDMETLVTEIADKCGPYTEISYDDWLQLTPYQQEHGRWDVTDVPGADGTVSIDLMTKLWENPNPTSDFAAQTIKLDLSGYDLIIAIATNSIISISENVVGKGFDLSEALSGSGGTAIRRRLGTISSTGIIWEAGYQSTSFSVGSVSNSIMKPYQIYGIKLHHTVEIKAIAPTVSTLAEKCMMSDGVTSVEEELDKLQVKSGSFDFNASLFTYKTVYYRKQGNVVMLSLNLKVSSAISADGVMGNVPSALRPQIRLWVTGSSGSFYLEPNGDFKTLTAKSSGNWIYATLTYII